MKLVVVIPVYNEESSIEIVIKEWNKALQALIPDRFALLVIDDGSTDGTPKILNGLSKEILSLICHQKKNSGHGKSCIFGYRMALQMDAEWILQIDSDYQCDPVYFDKFWDCTDHAEIIMGKRVKRLDGHYRSILTKIIALWIFCSTGRFCLDPNVPYRLIKADLLSGIMEGFPSISLANSYLSYKIMEVQPIHWIDIHFRNRLYGSSFHKLIPTFKAIYELTKALIFNQSRK